MDIIDMIEILREYIEVEVEKINEEEALIFLPEYQIHYKLHIMDWCFVEAGKLINNIELERAKINIMGENIKLFSASDLLELRDALREDMNRFNGVYKRYFFDKSGALKKEVDKRYLLDYITFINRAFFS